MATEISGWNKVTATAGVGAWFLLGRIAPARSARHLLAALDSPVEDASMAAYMALCKLGPKATPTVLDKIKRQGPSPARLQLLGDLGDPRAIPDLETFTHSKDPAIAAAAKESLTQLQQKT